MKRFLFSLSVWIGLPCAVVAVAADGSGRRHNRLVNEASPYLQFHADNPVDWYPWGEEALLRARREDKPIFLSIGYSTCYWCHVMERKVFSDPEIAALMNEWFVNVKVDREERPDLDQIYMTATQLLSGQAGWPNSVFLTPDLQPFFAGTYFPPEYSYGRPGFPSVLQKVHDAWRLRRAEVLKVAARVTETVRELEAGQQAPPMVPDTVLVNRALAAICGRYDARYGGFDGPPKFPPIVQLEFLLAAGERHVDERLAGIVAHTLRAMARGGIHDQVGGGFHRYATDAEWRMPHFEKMLYSQAHLARIYLRAYQVTGEEEWRRTAEEVLSFVAREMTAESGGFYSALDAETEGEEGNYYIWSETEIEAALGERAELFFELYALELIAEAEKGVIYARRSPEDAAIGLEMEAGILEKKVQAMRARLLQVRALRIYPFLDDKVLTAWNGMMIGAYACGYEVLGREDYRLAAEKAASFLLAGMRLPDGGLARMFRGGAAGIRGYLEDYAFLTQGLLELHRVTGEARWLQAAEEIVAQMVARFGDEEDGGFFFIEGGTDLIVRGKNGQDGALPAANAVAVHCLLDLAARTGRREYLERAERTLTAFGGMMRARPAGFTHMIAAAERYLREFGPVAGRNISFLAETDAPVDTLVRIRVEMSTRQPVPGERFAATVHLGILDGWHLNARPTGDGWQVPTSLALNAELPIDLLEVAYPEGSPLFFAAAGETLQVYAGQVALRADLRLPPEAVAGQEGDLHLRVRYQACDATRCLPPKELERTVRLRVGNGGKQP